MVILDAHGNFYIQESEFIPYSLSYYTQVSQCSTAAVVATDSMASLLCRAAVEPDLVDLCARPAVDGTKLALRNHELSASASASAMGPENAPRVSNHFNSVYPASTASTYENYLFSAVNIDVVDCQASTISAMLGPSNRFAIGKPVGELDGVNSTTWTDGGPDNLSTTD